MTDIAEELRAASYSLPCDPGKDWIERNGSTIPDNVVSRAADEIERLAREGKHGAHLFATARSQGWKDDGEGALEFVIRRSREVAIEDCREDRNAEIERLKGRIADLEEQLLQPWESGGE